MECRFKLSIAAAALYALIAACAPANAQSQGNGNGKGHGQPPRKIVVQVGKVTKSPDHPHGNGGHH